MALGLLLYLDRGIGFRLDDWYMVANRSGWSADNLLQPVNEHWFALTLVIFNSVLWLFGAHSAFPSLAALALVHVAAGLALYTLVARRSGWPLGILAMAAFLLIGQGSESLFWADQVSFAGSTLAGLWAVVLLGNRGPRARPVASLLLLASLMFSGAGLLFLLVAAGQLLLERARRGDLAVLLGPGLTYGLWFATYGRHPTRYGQGFVFDPRVLFPRVPLAILIGPAHSLVSLLELPLAAAVPLLAGGLVVLLHRNLRDRVRVDEVLPPLLAPVAFFVLVAIERPNLSIAVSRYVYVCAPFWLLALTSLAHSYDRPRLLPGLVIATVVLTVVNTVVLVEASAAYRRETGDRLAVLATIERARNCPGFDGSVEFSPDVVPAVTANRYLAAIDRLGSPVPDRLRTVPARESPASLAVLGRVFPGGAPRATAVGLSCAVAPR